MAITEPIKALIIASEVTKGMKSVGSKSLLKIKNSMLVIEYQIKELKKYYKDIDITIATGFESEKMIKLLNSYDVKFLYNSDYQTTNQAKSIIDYIEKNTLNKLLIITSGVLFKEIFLISGNHSCIFMLDKEKTDFTIGCNIEDDASYLFYDLPQKWSECVMVTNSDINILRKIARKKNLDQLYLFEIINLLSDRGSFINKIKISKKQIMKITNTKDLIKARSFV